MEIILVKGVTSLTGSFGRGYGYHIHKRKGRFFGRRDSRGVIPADGHLKFIFTCAWLAKTGLHIANVKLDAEELCEALKKAHKPQALQWATQNLEKGIKTKYDAWDIINFKTSFGL